MTRAKHEAERRAAATRSKTCASKLVVCGSPKLSPVPHIYPEFGSYNTVSEDEKLHIIRTADAALQCSYEWEDTRSCDLSQPASAEDGNKKMGG